MKKKHSVEASGSGEESIWGPVSVSQASSGGSQPLCAAGPSSVSVDSGSQGQAHPPHTAAPGDSELGGSAKAESHLGRGEPSCSGKAEDVSTSSHAGAVAVLTPDAPSEPTGAAETALVAGQEIEEATLESEYHDPSLAAFDRLLSEMVPHSFLLLGRKEHRDFTLSLREIAALLPITGTAHSRRITKAVTVAPQSRARPPSTGSQLSERVCAADPGRDSQPAEVRGRGEILHEGEGCDRRRRLYEAESRWDDTNRAGLSDWPVLHNTDSSSPCPSSQDSEWSCRQTPRATATPTGGVSDADLRTPAEDRPCSACGEQRGSEEGRPVRSQVFDSPDAGSGGLLLKDHMLWWYPSSGEDEPTLTPSSPPHPSTGSSPLRTLCFGEDLNLSPSLLTSPARDLALSFLQEGQENLHVLFEDVWVNAMHSSESQEHSTDNTAELDSLLGGGWLSSASEGEERGDFTWTPSKRGPPRGGRGRHRPRPRRPLYAKPHLKKKCVNGFIMYCRLNRKSYLR
ncbi:UNVERIFIED_CONTAM: hypothetical protein FKN15_042742 [Acipenser sinensis]